MAHAVKARPNSARARRKEEAQYRLLMAVSFAVFLVGALLARLVPARWRAAQQKGERQSVIAEARAAAQTSVPFAFMS
ncbi:MAG: hypothetical protein LLP51_06105 [Halorhodospira halophila]|uniref:hypothetical protein n=1 Tax=Halorhodospira TaxID=85108 RepID=UPI001EE8869D|nr:MULTISPECIES: hypothetical protein [Halorhodospira]MCC3750950.1 hypothetical protein [Halorhodospira halophila]MCG5527965.1 hypothetical protein [Halorhodospira halophila]MCG5533293.1 hypothetical protein [Halorhodospira sp. 9621]MCG5536867.1 hypothetical protein [Halorhodospira sp. 9622]MCG5539594.1 hypothetical protein [Halorhodospira sp. M39old]